jgi:hypothetical protein
MIDAALVELERRNFAAALDNPEIDKTKLLAMVTRFERARRLASQPEPLPCDIRLAPFLVAIGR